MKQIEILITTTSAFVFYFISNINRIKATEISKWENLPNPNPKNISDNQSLFMIDNILNTFFTFGAFISILMIAYGIIIFILAVIKKNAPNRNNALKIIIYGILLMFLFAFIYGLMYAYNPPTNI